MTSEREKPWGPWQEVLAQESRDRSSMGPLNRAGGKRWED